MISRTSSLYNLIYNEILASLEHEPVGEYDLCVRNMNLSENMTCAYSEDSDQPGHPPSLISVLAVRLKKVWTLAIHKVHRENSDQTGQVPGWSESSLPYRAFQQVWNTIISIRTCLLILHVAHTLEFSCNSPYTFGWIFMKCAGNYMQLGHKRS